MDRRLDNIFIVEKGQGLNYTPPGNRGGTKNYPPRDSRMMHGEHSCLGPYENRRAF